MERLRKWMKRTNTNQDKLAELLGVTQGYVSRLMAGKRWPGGEVVTRLTEITHGEVTGRDFYGKKSSVRAS